MEPHAPRRSLLPLFSEDDDEAVRLATERLQRFPALFEAAHARVLRAKLGLFLREEEGDPALAANLLERLRLEQRRLHRFFPAAVQRRGQSFRRRAGGVLLFDNPGAFHDWAEAWRRRLAKDDLSLPRDAPAGMRLANPAFIPRNHRVEAIIQAAVSRTDFAPFEALVAVLSTTV